MDAQGVDKIIGTAENANIVSLKLYCMFES